MLRTFVLLHLYVLLFSVASAAHTSIFPHFSCRNCLFFRVLRILLHEVFLIPSQAETLCSFLFFLNYYLFLAVLGLGCCVQAFSSGSEQELLSSCNAQAFHCGEFSCCRAQAVGEWVSVVTVHKLSCPIGAWYLNSQTRNWTHVPCIDRQTFNHWTSGESSLLFLIALAYVIWALYYSVLYLKLIGSCISYVLDSGPHSPYPHLKKRIPLGETL